MTTSAVQPRQDVDDTVRAIDRRPAGLPLIYWVWLAVAPSTVVAIAVLTLI
jgi:hypothetical protein